MDLTKWRAWSDPVSVVRVGVTKSEADLGGDGESPFIYQIIQFIAFTKLKLDATMKYLLSSVLEKEKPPPCPMRWLYASYG